MSLGFVPAPITAGKSVPMVPTSTVVYDPPSEKLIPAGHGKLIILSDLSAS